MTAMQACKPIVSPTQTKPVTDLHAAVSAGLGYRIAKQLSAHRVRALRSLKLALLSSHIFPVFLRDAGMMQLGKRESSGEVPRSALYLNMF